MEISMNMNCFNILNEIMKMIWRSVFIVLLILFQPGVVLTATDKVSDTENCLLCHRYPNIGRYDETGQKRSFYINEDKYARSVHGKLRCKSCHVGLDTIPHTDVKKVDCSTKCHIEEPSANKEFSHANVIEKFRTSVHGEGTGPEPRKYVEDLPTCKSCHTNRMYSPLSGMWGKSEELIDETLTRCKGCHTEPQWTERFFSHFAHRMRRRRSQREIVALCTGCHENQQKMSRHGLESVEPFKDTFHWAQVKYHVENAPDCISCHIPVGFSTHDIRPRTDPASSIHVDNRVNTCSNQGGLQVCHPGATQKFAGGNVHSYRQKDQMLAGLAYAGGEDENWGYSSGTDGKELPEKRLMEYKILSLIRFVYKLLIAVVVGSMILHQLLDYRCAKKHMKNHH